MRNITSRKFIKLANREDTQDVQSVLQDWRAGKIKSKARNPRPKRSSAAPDSALHEITDNQQTRLPAPITKSKPQLDRAPAKPGRKLAMSRRQQSMNNFVTRETFSAEDPLPPVRDNKFELGPTNRAKKSRGLQHPARPAQLEASEIPYSERYPTSAFRSTKRILDTLYRNTRRRPVSQTNLQLSRFLADDDIVRPSIETSNDPVHAEEDEVELVEVAAKPTRRKQS